MQRKHTYKNLHLDTNSQIKRNTYKNVTVNNDGNFKLDVITSTWESCVPFFCGTTHYFNLSMVLGEFLRYRPTTSAHK